MDNQWLNKNSKELFRALSSIENEDDMAIFCRDLMTEAEIDAFSCRWQVALLLSKGESQRNASEKTGVSIATVTRVNRWLNRGMGGYKKLINSTKKIQNLHSHTKAD